MMFARFGIISENCVVTLQGSEAKNLYAVECLRHFESKTITCTVCAAYLAKINVSHGACNILKVSLVNGVAFAHFAIDICKLDAIVTAF